MDLTWIWHAWNSLLKSVNLTNRCSKYCTIQWYVYGKTDTFKSQGPSKIRYENLILYFIVKNKLDVKWQAVHYSILINEVAKCLFSLQHKIGSFWEVIKNLWSMRRSKCCKSGYDFVSPAENTAKMRVCIIKIKMMILTVAIFISSTARFLNIRLLFNTCVQKMKGIQNII